MKVIERGMRQGAMVVSDSYESVRKECPGCELIQADHIICVVPTGSTVTLKMAVERAKEIMNLLQSHAKEIDA